MVFVFFVCLVLLSCSQLAAVLTNTESLSENLNNPDVDKKLCEAYLNFILFTVIYSALKHDVNCLVGFYNLALQLHLSEISLIHLASIQSKALFLSIP